MFQLFGLITTFIEHTNIFFFLHFKNNIYYYKNAAEDDLLEKSDPDGVGDFETSTHLKHKIQEES